MDLLQQVREKLQASTGHLRVIASETGIPYDTVLRVKNGEGDPGFSVVERLRCYFASRVPFSARLPRETVPRSV